MPAVRTGITGKEKNGKNINQLIDILLKDNLTVYCCGKEDEIIDHPGVTPFTGMPLQETAALINQCDLFLSNDSGLMHIAAALRKKQIAVFTATDHKKSGPYYNPRAQVITPRIHVLSRARGRQEVWDHCTDWLCRQVISEEDVYGEIRKVMDLQEAQFRQLPWIERFLSLLSPMTCGTICSRAWQDW